MVWPTKYGTAASQGSAAPEPPDRSEATAVESLRHYQASVITYSNFSLLPPDWADAPVRNLDAEFILNRVPGQSGTVFPGSTSVGNRQEALLQVYWPRSTSLGKENFISLIKIESRPVGATSWRSSSTTINWEVGTNPQATGEAFLFAGVPTDEYRASALYAFSNEPVYSAIKSVDKATISLGYYEQGKVPAHNAGPVVQTIIPYSFSTVIIPAEAEDRAEIPLHNNNIEIRGVSFYAYFADRVPREYNESLTVHTHTTIGNTTSSLNYSQFLS